MKISVILVNYNNTHDTINCLKSLKNQSYIDIEIVIVDNDSDEQYKTQLKRFLKDIENDEIFSKKIFSFYSDKNTGFTGGCNIGISKSKGDLILLLNSDTLCEPEFLEVMVNFFKKYSKVHIAQPMICLYPTKNLIWCNGGQINKFSFNIFKSIDYLEEEKNVRAKPFKIHYAAGCALFIRRYILQDIGLLDNTFFMYGEESDLCYRAMLKGYTNIYCNPRTKIYHIQKQGFSPSYKKFYFRNRNIWCFKHLSLKFLIIQTFLQFIQLLVITINYRERKIDHKFLFKSIRGIIIGIKIGIIYRLRNRSKKLSKIQKS